MVFFAYHSLTSTRPDWIWQNDFFVNEFLTTLESHNEWEGNKNKTRMLLSFLRNLPVGDCSESRKYRNSR